MYNLICAVSFAIMAVAGFLVEKTKKSMLVLRIMSVIIFVYKIIHYVLENGKGNFSIPVEISSITYFLMCVILVFKIKTLYSVGSFFGMASGIGYFLFYLLFGFTVSDSFSIKEILIGCFSHGYLLLAGIYLFRTNDFSESEKPKIWVTIFAMLAWALVFYDMEIRGLTFIYYVIKPTFLFFFENMSLNAVLMAVYYALLVTAFYFVIKLFFALNARRVKTCPN